MNKENVETVLLIKRHIFMTYLKKSFNVNVCILLG